MNELRHTTVHGRVAAGTVRPSNVMQMPAERVAATAASSQNKQHGFTLNTPCPV